MTPEQALNILDQIAASVRMSRADHAQAVEAVMALRQFIAQRRPTMPLVQPPAETEAMDSGSDSP